MITVEYLVTMTTHVPDGTPDQEVADVRAREVAHSRELVAQGHLLRLWRPPLRPGEWRTLGLFAAADSGELEKVLASMPLRIWRTDEVTPLAPHPNDPVPQPAPVSPEFLTAFTLTIPSGTPDALVEDTNGREAERARELGRQGRLLRLWRLPPGGPDALGLWHASDQTEMETILDSLPQSGWLTVQTTPLTGHPNDPALAASSAGR